MIKGKTKSGFKYQIDEVKLDDMELFDLFAEVDTNPLLFPKILSEVLGEEQKKALYDHCRADDGRVPVDTVSAETREIFSNSQIKN